MKSLSQPQGNQTLPVVHTGRIQSAPSGGKAKVQ
jgi:hypothetical protein